MRKKNLLIGAFAAVAVVMCGAFGINSVKADDAAQSDATQELVFEQVGRDDYTKRSTRNGVSETVLITDDNKYCMIISEDGTTYELDNSEGKFGTIDIASSSYYKNCVYSVNDNNECALIDYNGNFIFESGKYYPKNSISYFCKFKNKEYFFIGNSKEVIIKDIEGNDYSDKITLDENYSFVSLSNLKDKYLVVKERNDSSIKYKYYDEAFNEVDLASKFAIDGYNVSKISSYGKDYYVVSYTIPSSKAVYKKYFNANFTEYNNDKPTLNGSISSVDRPGYRVEIYNYGYIFSRGTYDLYRHNENIKDNYYKFSTGVIKGVKVSLAGESTQEKGYSNYAIFDENNNMLIDNVDSYQTSRADKVIVKDTSEDGTVFYKVMKASLKSETGKTEVSTDNNGDVVADITAKEVDERELEDADGNKITVEDLDEDAKAVIGQKFDFSLKAAKEVIPDNTQLSVAKVVSGKEYNSAKNATKDYAAKIAVFDITLLDKDNVKVQPNGKLQITTEIPAGYNAERVAVYRLSEDGNTFVKLSSKVTDGKVTFETDHFSTYMIVEEKENVAAPSPVVPEDKVDTADSSNVFVYVLMLLLAGMTAVTVYGKKRA